MKTLTTFLMLAPGVALAHGGHVEMSAAAHDTFHIGPWVAAGLIVAAVFLALIRGQDQ